MKYREYERMPSQPYFVVEIFNSVSGALFKKS